MTGAGAVIGLGGVFWRSGDPQRLSAWYAQHLGIRLGGPNPQASGVAVPAAFPADSDYWPTGRVFMVNFRVADLDLLVVRLEGAGIAVERRADWDTPEAGRFARITDPDGAPIELWEAPEGL